MVTRLSGGPFALVHASSAPECIAAGPGPAGRDCLNHDHADRSSRFALMTLTVPAVRMQTVVNGR